MCSLSIVWLFPASLYSLFMCSDQTSYFEKRKCSVFPLILKSPNRTSTEWVCCQWCTRLCFRLSPHLFAMKRFFFLQKNRENINTSKPEIYISCCWADVISFIPLRHANKITREVYLELILYNSALFQFRTTPTGKPPSSPTTKREKKFTKYRVASFV